MEIIATLSLLVAIASLCTGFYIGLEKLKQRANEQKQLRAPLLQIVQYKPLKDYVVSPQQNDSWASSGQFTLDRRSFGPKGQEKPQYSLYLNATHSPADEHIDLFAMGVVYIKSVGHSIAAVELVEVTIYYPENRKLSMTPRKVNNKPVHYILNMTKETIEVLFSIKSPKTGPYRFQDFNKIKESNVEEKLNLYANDALNVYIPGRLRCDHWEKIVLHFITYNSHNEAYRQNVEVHNRDGVITTHSLKPSPTYGRR